VYLYNGQQIIETRDGSNNMVQQFIHGTQYIDELVMVRVADKGDLYVHQDANWNVIGLTDLGGHLVERYVYTPYGELTVHQATGYGDRDGDRDVDSDDKGTPGTDCTGTVSGSCRILDLDFDGDYDSTDASLFDALPQGLAQHPGRTFTAVDQPFAHQGLLYDAEIMTYQNRARQYDPNKRRFVQRDPLLLVKKYTTSLVLPKNVHGTNTMINLGVLRTRFNQIDATNLYAYVNHNPLGNFDPSGAFCIPYYGNWCGPGWSGGQCVNECGELDNDAAPPIDEADQCCYEHDSCYEDNDSTYPDPYCDDPMCSCLLSVGASSSLTMFFCR